MCALGAVRVEVCYRGGPCPRSPIVSCEDPSVCHFVFRVVLFAVVVRIQFVSQMASRSMLSSVRGRFSPCRSRTRRRTKPASRHSYAPFTMRSMACGPSSNPARLCPRLSPVVVSCIRGVAFGVAVFGTPHSWRLPWFSALFFCRRALLLSAGLSVARQLRFPCAAVCGRCA